MKNIYRTRDLEAFTNLINFCKEDNNILTMVCKTNSLINKLKEQIESGKLFEYIRLLDDDFTLGIKSNFDNINLKHEFNPAYLEASHSPQESYLLNPFNTFQDNDKIDNCTLASVNLQIADYFVDFKNLSITLIAKLFATQELSAENQPIYLKKLEINFSQDFVAAMCFDEPSVNTVLRLPDTLEKNGKSYLLDGLQVLTALYPADPLYILQLRFSRNLTSINNSLIKRTSILNFITKNQINKISNHFNTSIYNKDNASQTFSEMLIFLFEENIHHLYTYKAYQAHSIDLMDHALDLERDSLNTTLYTTQRNSLIKDNKNKKRKEPESNINKKIFTSQLTQHVMTKKK